MGQPRLFDDQPFVAKKNEQGSLFDDPPEDVGAATADEEDAGEEDEDDEATFPDDLFPFYREEKELVAGCERFVRLLLKRDDVTPRQVIELGSLLAGLERLPRPTENLCVSASLSFEQSGSKMYQTLELSASEFRIDNAGWVSGPAGGDSVSNTVFEIEVGWRDEDCSPLEAYDWIASVCRSAPDASFAVVVEDTSDAPVQWQWGEEDSSGEGDAWERLPVM